MSDYTTDPHWQAANERFLQPTGDTPSERMACGILAAVEMHRIETEHEAAA